MNYRKIGGLHFIKIHNLTISFCISKKRKLKKVGSLFIDMNQWKWNPAKQCYESLT